MQYTAIVERGRESGCVVYLPALKGCVAEGATKEDALADLREAAVLYVQCLQEDGIMVPTEEGKEIVGISRPEACPSPSA